MSDPKTPIYSAVYSGIPVWEMRINGVDVMRRVKDSYLNATQILKVANIDKPLRTKILEREVQTGTHEKVQGGYGKYQGTWVPFSRGVDLCREYKVYDVLQPILEHDPNTDPRPPNAPKKTLNIQNRGERKSGTPGGSPSGTPKRTPKKPKKLAEGATKVEKSPQPRMSPGPGAIEREEKEGGRRSQPPSSKLTSSSTGRRPKLPKDTSPSRSPGRPRKEVRLTHEDDYRDQIIKGLLDKGSLPNVLTTPPPDLDLTLPIDEHGHTALHWAAALARVDCCRIILNHGIKPAIINKDDTTPLMWAVHFDDNYKEQTFPQLLDLLLPSIFNCDKNGQTVIHHIARIAGDEGKTQSSHYYLDCVLQKGFNKAISARDFNRLLNHKDKRGDTALHISAREDYNTISEMLVQAGALTKIPNQNSETAEQLLGTSFAEPSVQPDVDIQTHSIPHIRKEPEHSEFDYPPTSKKAKLNSLQREDFFFDNSISPAQSDANISTAFSAVRSLDSATSLHPPLQTVEAAAQTQTLPSLEITRKLEGVVAKLNEQYSRDLDEKNLEIAEHHLQLNQVNCRIDETKKKIQNLEPIKQEFSSAQEKSQELRSHLIHDLTRFHQLLAATLPDQLDNKKSTKPSPQLSPAKRTSISNNTRSSSPSIPPANATTDPNLLKQHIDQLNSELSNIRTTHQSLLNQIIDLISVATPTPDTSGSGSILSIPTSILKSSSSSAVASANHQSPKTSSSKLELYRRFISKSCGVPETEVDSIIDELMEGIESGDIELE